jgi:hypothetical protein
MGQIISLVTNIIKTATKIRTEVKQDEADEDRRKLDEIKTPIEPPKFYRSIEERKKVVKDEKNPYSVTSIKQSLERDVIPVGYSLEQLNRIGFESAVKDFIDRRKKRREELKTEFQTTIDAIEKEVNEGYNNLSREDRILFDKSGIGQEENRKKILSRIVEWKKQVSEDTVTSSMIDEMINLMKMRVDTIQDVFSAGEFDKKIQDEIEESERKKTSQALKIVRRALKVV